MTDDVQKLFDDAHEKLVSVLCGYITGGFIEQFAKVLVYMGKQKAEETIAKIPEHIQNAVRKSYNALSSKKVTDPEIISAVCSVLNQSDFSGKEINDFVSKDIQEFKAAELLANRNSLFEIDPIITLHIESSLISFESVQLLDDRSIQKLLREVATDVLVKALFGASEATKEKFFRNLSERAAALLQEDIDFTGPVRPADVQDARQTIMDIILRLEKDGDVVIARKCNL